MNRPMANQKNPSKLGSLLTTFGYVAFFLFVFGRNFLGDTTALFFPLALGAIFVGRIVTSRARRKPMDDVIETSQPVERPRPTPKPARPQPPRQEPVRAPQPKKASPDPARVEADLEKALAAYRVEPESDTPILGEPIVMEFGDIETKTSAEMIAEAREQWDEEES